MKKKYSISFFVGIVICFAILSFAFQKSYQNVKGEILAQQKENMSVPTKGNASKADVYYLKDLNGFLAVYKSDKKTLYEYTDIRMDELPKELAAEIRNWKAIETLENLYGFLENYSS